MYICADFWCPRIFIFYFKPMGSTFLSKFIISNNLPFKKGHLDMCSKKHDHKALAEPPGLCQVTLWCCWLSHWCTCRV